MHLNVSVTESPAKLQRLDTTMLDREPAFPHGQRGAVIDRRFPRVMKSSQQEHDRPDAQLPTATRPNLACCR